MDLSILYLGADSGTSLHRARALERLGCRVHHINERRFLPASAWIESWLHHSGAMFLSGAAERRLIAVCPNRNVDFIWVNGGQLLGPEVLVRLRDKYQCPIVNYNNDDPFGGRDGRKWRLYLQSLPFYDLTVVLRECNVSEARAAGATNVLRVTMSADELAHAPRRIDQDDHVKWGSDVVFIGTWMPERGPLLAGLVRSGVPLTIFGENWHRAKEWAILQKQWRGAALGRDEYAKAVQCAKVCLGLVSKGNRDLSTTRSFEVPHLGGVLCAERTTEHCALYKENLEAVFWNTPDECVEQCLRLLKNQELRDSLALNGRIRCLQNRSTNESILGQVLAAASKIRDTPIVDSISCKTTITTASLC